MKRNLKPRQKISKGLVVVANNRFQDSGAWKLKDNLGCNLLKPDKLPKVKLSPTCQVINWGSSRLPIWNQQGHKILNPPDKVRLAVNKLFCLQQLYEAEVPCVDFFTEAEEAARAALDTSLRIFCRTRLTGHSGDGIVVISGNEKLVPAPLYTIEFPKTHEYRIHVFKGKVIDRAQKKTMGEEKLKEHDIPEVIKTVRNLKNGWFYSKEDLLYDEEMDQIAIDAVQTVGLDFGAVDVLAIWSKSTPKNPTRKLKNAAVCEINTAPGLEAPSTLEAYVKAFKEHIHA